MMNRAQRRATKGSAYSLAATLAGRGCDIHGNGLVPISDASAVEALIPMGNARGFVSGSATPARALLPSWRGAVKINPSPHNNALARLWPLKYRRARLINNQRKSKCPDLTRKELN